MSGGVPPSSRARGRRHKNPRADVMRRAVDLYESFSGHDAEVIGTVQIPDDVSVGVCIGTLDGVLYTTVRDGVTERYIHEFKSRDKPMLVVSPDGEQMWIVGGNYDFTERGIVDGSDAKTRREMGLPVRR
jgi:hypothetical protein